MPDGPLDAIVSKQKVSQVLERVEHLLARRHDVVAREQEAVAPRVPQLDLVAVPRVELVW